MRTFAILLINTLAVILGLLYANLIIFLFHTGIFYTLFWLLALGFSYGCLGVWISNGPPRTLLRSIIDLLIAPFIVILGFGLAYWGYLTVASIVRRSPDITKKWEQDDATKLEE